MGIELQMATEKEQCEMEGKKIVTDMNIYVSFPPPFFFLFLAIDRERLDTPVTEISLTREATTTIVYPFHGEGSNEAFSTPLELDRSTMIITVTGLSLRGKTEAGWRSSQGGSDSKGKTRRDKNSYT